MLSKYQLKNSYEYKGDKPWLKKQFIVEYKKLNLSYDIQHIVGKVKTYFFSL